MKLLLVHVLVDCHEENQETILQLDEIQAQLWLLNYKVNLSACKLTGMDLSIVEMPPTKVPKDTNHPFV